MKRVFLYILSVFTLLSCRNSEDRFSLSGEFKHLQQGEFYIYSPDGAIDHLDTIKVVGGAFDYQIPLKNKSTLMLLYPNYSEHVIFAEGGEEVKIKADARKLGEAEITGTPANEEMTRFRIENLKNSKEQTARSAESYIRKNPTSDVSLYLFKEYFLNNPERDGAKTLALYQILTKALPDNMRLKALQNKIQGISGTTIGKKLPDFKLIGMKGDTINTSKLKGKATLISFWASWRNSGYVIYQSRKLKRKYGNQLGIIAYSLDINPKILENSLKRDSINWPVYCDFKGWDNPLLQKLNVNDIPYHILIDSERKIIARGRNIDKDILPELEKRLK